MKKSKTNFPRTEKYRFTNHEKNKSLFRLHAKKNCPFTRHEKSIGDPQNTPLPPIECCMTVVKDFPKETTTLVGAGGL